MLDKLLTKMAITISLGILLSYTFVWSNNAHMFSFTALGFSSLVVLLVSAIIWFLGEVWIKLCSMFFKKSPQICHMFNSIIFSCALTLTLGMLFLETSLNPTPVKPVLAALWIIIFSLFYINKVKHVNTVMLIFIVISLVRLGGAMVSIASDMASHKQSTQQEPIVNVVFMKKPNIYLFWLESYHSFTLQETIYNIDTSEIKNFLDKNDFIIYDSVYADSPHTLAAFEDLFGLGKISSKIYGILDASSVTRNLIAGSDDNVLLKTLKNNNYLTQITFSENFYYYTEGLKFENLDVTNYRESWILTNSLPLNAFISDKINFFKSTWQKVFTAEEIGGPLTEQVNMLMQNGFQSGKPFFLGFKGGAEHTPPTPGLYDYKTDIVSFLSESGYPSLIKKANIEITAIVQSIIENDPNSIIILVGDHGAWRYRNLWQGNRVHDFVQEAQKANIAYKDTVDDIFDIHLSIRLPKGENYDLTAQKYYLSPVNLFTHIFAYLSDNPSLLTGRTTSQSDYFGTPIIKDGKILESDYAN